METVRTVLEASACLRRHRVPDRSTGDRSGDAKVHKDAEHVVSRDDTIFRLLTENSLNVNGGEVRPIESKLFPLLTQALLILQAVCLLGVQALLLALFGGRQAVPTLQRFNAGSGVLLLLGGRA